MIRREDDYGVEIPKAAAVEAGASIAATAAPHISSDMASAASPEREFSPATIGVLVASVIALSLGPSGLLFSTFTLFMEPISNEFGWSRAGVSFLMTVLGVSIAIGSPTKGYLFDRFGVRNVVTPLTFALGFAIAGLAVTRGDNIAIYALFALIGLLTPGNVPFGKIIAEWFHRKRGMAYGLLGLGYVLSAPAALQAGRLLIDSSGWRSTFLVFGALQLLVALPIVFFLLKSPPSSLIGTRLGSSGEAPHAAPGATLSDALRSSSYWLIVVNLVLGVFVYIGVMTHGVAILTEKGLSREDAATALSALSIGGMLSQPLLGYLMDRFATARIALPFGLAAPFGLAIVQVSNELPVLAFGFAVLGLGAGGEVGTTQYFVSRYFGLRHFSVIYGSIQPFTLSIAIGLGPFLLGLIYDLTGSYRLNFWIMEGALVVAATLLLLLGPYRYEASAQATADVRK